MSGYQLKIASWLGMWVCVHFYSQQSYHNSQTLCRTCVCCLSLCVHMSFNHNDLEDLVFRPSGSSTLPSLPQVLWAHHCSRGLPRWLLSKRLIYENSRMWLRIFLWLDSFTRTIVSLGPWVSGSWLSKIVKYEFYLWKWILNTIRYSLVLQALCHYCMSTSYMQVTTVDQSSKVCGWVGVYLSPLVACQVLSSPPSQ